MRFAVLLGCILGVIILCFMPQHTDARSTYSNVCRASPWKVRCNTPVQARFMALGMFTMGKTQNVVECMSRSTQATCEGSLTADGYDCSWCPTPAVSTEKLGEGSCLLATMKRIGICRSMARLVIDPMVALDMPLLPPAEEAKCLKRSASESECQEDVSCSYCVLPDAFGWKDNKNVCLDKRLMPDDIAKNWCKHANTLPRGIVDKNITWTIDYRRPLRPSPRPSRYARLG